MLKFSTKNCAFDLLQIPEPKFEMQVIGFMKQILKSKKKKAIFYPENELHITLKRENREGVIDYVYSQWWVQSNTLIIW